MKQCGTDVEADGDQQCPSGGRVPPPTTRPKGDPGAASAGNGIKERNEIGHPRNDAKNHPVMVVPKTDA